MKKMYNFLKVLTIILLGANASATAQYCTGGSTIGCSQNDQYQSFSTSGGITNINHNPGGTCVGDANGDASFSGPGLSASVLAGGTISFSITNTVTWQEGYAIWVDWNHNSVFDAGEEVYASSGTVAQGGTVTGSFSVPSGAYIGTTDLRIRCSYNVSGTTIDPCAFNTFGITFDFPFTVIGPVFANGSPQPFGVCINAPATSLAVPLTASDNTGATLTWTLISGPSHGSVSGFPATAASGNNVSPTGVTYTPNAGYTGPDVLFVMVSDGTRSATSTINITVSPLPTAISGAGTVCVGGTTTLSDATAFGDWSSSAIGVASVGSSTGVVTGATTGPVTITYTSSAGCSVTKGLTVNPAAGSITGTATVCAGSTTALTDASAGGVWTSSNTFIATVAAGTVTGAAAGVATITYTLPTGCFSTLNVTVNALPVVSAGANTAVCAGASATLAATGATTYTWLPTSGLSCTNCAGPIATPTVTTTYTVTGTAGCSNKATVTVTVNPLPSAISGASTVCNGLTTTLTDATAFGAWSSSNSSVASIGTSDGIVTGMLPGTSTITYTLGTGCIAKKAITVNPLPNSISGVTSVCAGSVTTLSDIGGGVWSSSNTAIATVDASGNVTGIVAGGITITYTIPTGCIATTPFTVNALPGRTFVSGGGSFCNNTTITATSSSGTIYFQGTTSGGTSTATPSASQSITSSGTYFFRSQSASGCWGVQGSVAVVINPLPAAITGSTGVCAGNSISLTDAGGGTWSSSNSAVATIDGTGTVSSITAGTTTITYTLPTGCTATTLITVNPLPVVSGGANVAICNGLSTTLTGTGGAIYSWSPADGLSCTNCASPVASPTVTTTYTVTGSEASNSTFNYSGSIQSYTVPAGVTSINITASGAQGGQGNAFGGFGANMSGTFTVVPGHVLNILVGQQPAGASLTGGGGGGSYVWDVTASNTLLIVAGGGGGSGAFTGSDDGIDAVTTNDGTNGGGGFNGAGTAGNGGIAVSGTLDNAYAGGGAGWLTNGNGGSSDGFCSDATGGSTPLNGGAGGTYGGSFGVNGDGGFGGGGGSQGICSYVGGGGGGGYSGGAGGGFDFSGNANPGGGGGSYNIGTAQVNSVGNTGNGIVTIATSGCSNTAMVTVTVNPLPAAIAGTTNVCAGLTTTLTDATTGGAWSTSDMTLATVGTSSGVVTGVAAGVPSITYTLPTGCIMTTPVTVNPLPSNITGATNAVCAGLTISFTDATTGGAWSSSNTAQATVDGSGNVTGVAAGNPTITYTLPTGCIAITSVTVNPLPSVITGTNNVCAGLTTTLSDSVSAGVWSSGNTSVASIDLAGGIVTGITAGTATITYTLPATGCIMTTIETVNPLPAAISGDTVVCAGLSTALSDATGSGAWSSSDTTLATVDAVSGNVTGVSAGTPAITYMLPTGCIITTSVTVNPLPATITGNTSVCAGLTTALSDTTSAGVWSSSNTAAATVDPATGIVTAIAANTTTITYTIPTGCIMTDLVTVNPLPSIITGSTIVCQNATTTLSDSLSGGAWTSGNTAVASANPATGIITGVAAGMDTITYTLPTTCMITTTVVVNAAPTAYTVTGTGSYCAGSTGLAVGLNGSDTGFSYQLFYGGLPIDTLAGTDTALNFGLHTLAGAYTVVSTNDTTGCTNNMTSNALITINPLPLVHTVTGGGSYCAGGTGVHVGLDSSDTGINYLLFSGGTIVDSPKAGTDSMIDFGLITTAGTYTVIGMNVTTGCSNNMADSAVVVITPIPVPSVSIYHGDYDTVCNGALVTFTATPVNPGTMPVYQWTVNGNPAGFDSTTYSYVPVNGDVVVAVLLSNATCVSPVSASSEVTVIVDTVFIPALSISATPGLIISKGQSDTLKAVVVNGGPAPLFQWYKNGHAIAGATAADYISTTLANKDSISCIVTGTGNCGMETFNSVIMQVSTTGITQVAQPGIDVTVIPNPNSGTFTIKGSLGVATDEKVSLEVTNMLGQSIYKNEVIAHEGAINEEVQLGNTLASGMYLLSVHSGNENKVFHIVIKQ